MDNGVLWMVLVGSGWEAGLDQGLEVCGGVMSV